MRRVRVEHVGVEALENLVGLDLALDLPQERLRNRLRVAESDYDRCHDVTGMVPWIARAPQNEEPPVFRGFIW
jgi:hypothetical protein